MEWLSKATDGSNFPGFSGLAVTIKWLLLKQYFRVSVDLLSQHIGDGKLILKQIKSACSDHSQSQLDQISTTGELFRMFVSFLVSF